MGLTLIVLAAGLSTRYNGLKQLERVGPAGEALLDYGIYDATRAGFERFVLVIRRELEEAFREHLGERYGAAVEVVYAHQELDALPSAVSSVPNRKKPWGTGHAVLAAAPQVAGPFVVMNADDFYGASAFAILADYLRDAGSPGTRDFGTAGYRLRDTLSPSGGVSRAICDVGADGFLCRVREVRDIRARKDGLTGRTLSGELYELEGEELVSMNLWAATPVAFSLLEGEFAEFLERRGHDPDAEFLLSEAVNALIARGRARVRVLPTTGPWLGVTHPGDRMVVERRLRELVEAGHYPPDLGAALGRR